MRSRHRSPPAETPASTALIHEFLDLGLPRDVLPARDDVIGWLDEWLRLHSRVGSDCLGSCDELFLEEKADDAHSALRPYVLRLFVRWLAQRGDLSPTAADRLTLTLAPYCDARRFFPG